MKCLLIAVTLLGVSLAGAGAAPKTVRVFVALCDNETQAIAPVPARIGNGDDPENNLYWGCSDGLAKYFGKSPHWKLTKSEKDVTPEILVRLEFHHTGEDLQLVAEAYRGSAIVSCLRAFERTLAAGENHFVAYIGHNGLMDNQLKPPKESSDKRPAAVVLCCRSAEWFLPRLKAAGGDPILLTDQFMYPGAFLLHDAIEAWRLGKSKAEVRAAAGRAYARNQKIALRAATGVFTSLD